MDRQKMKEKLDFLIENDACGMWTEGNEILKQLRAELEDEEAL